VNKLLDVLGMKDKSDGTDAELRAELDAIHSEFATFRSEFAALRQHLGEVTSHHGDVLTETVGRLNRLETGHGDALVDAIGRLNRVESKHGDALVALGQKLEVVAAMKTAAAQPGFDQPPSKNVDLALPSGTFLGEIPGRYNDDFITYKARGGLVDPQANTIRYSYGDPVRFYFLSMAFDVITREKLAGNIAELGVYQGDTAALLADFARKTDRTAYLLDTFEGFDDRDLAPEDSHLSGHFAETSIEMVRQRVGVANTAFVQGFFPDSASQLPADGRYCLVHIDADLYDPIKAGLDYFYPRVVDGGFIVVHDVMSMCWDGATKAVEDFLADKPEFFIPIPDMAGTIAFRKQAQR